MVDSATLLTEAHRRFTGYGDMRAAADELRVKLRAELFDKQLVVVNDPARRKSVRCPRRAGKTSLIPRWIVDGSIEKGELTQLWAISHGRCKELFWDELGRLSERHNIGARFNDSELSIRWPWAERAITRLKGADKAKETSKKRGDRLGRAGVDECQLMDQHGAFLEPLIDEVLEPATQDVGGDLACFGTPGYVCEGFWHDIAPNDPSQAKQGWSPHSWHTRENAAMPHIWSNFLRMKEEKGWKDENPTWIREYLGRWVDDPDALMYAYEDARNGIDRLPELPGMAYVLGWDLGSGGLNDPMALHVWGFSPSSPNLWAVASWKNPDAGLDATMAEVTRIERSLGGFAAEVADTGGGGKIAVDYVNQRFGRSFKAANKAGKFGHITLMNDDYRSGTIKVLRGSPLHAEVTKLPKSPDDPTKEHEGWPNHCTDASLYSYMEARHFWGQVPVPPPVSGSPEALALEEQRMIEQLEEQDRAEDDFRKSWGF